MSELIQKNDNPVAIRWRLLLGASALALTAHIAASEAARAEDADRPTVWIELGGQLNRLQDGQEVYAPPFVSLTPADFESPEKSERPPRFGLDSSLKLTFQPEGSDWNFSAAIRYGRATSAKHVRQQSYPTSSYVGYRNFALYYPTGYVRRGHQILQPIPYVARFSDVTTKQQENHLVLDFQAGKDVGLGLFGRDATSSISAGVRFAQFTSKSRAALLEDPDWAFKAAFYSTVRSFYGYRTVASTKLIVQPYHMFSAHFEAERSFSGLGPSISWSSTVPFAGNTRDGALSFDWGVNAALLFGRQKTKIHRQTTALYHEAAVTGYFFHRTSLGTRVPVYDHQSTSDRSHNVVVPNVGGFAGISFKYSEARVSFGYKADFFFGAMDGGIDTRKTYNRSFYGPFASVSIGLGG